MRHPPASPRVRADPTLRGLERKYGYNSVFLISAKTNNYYHYNGIHKHISPDDAHDVWYYNFLKTGKSYALDVDTDEADHNTLTVFVDWNKQQLDGELDEIISAFDLEGKFRAFGFDVATVKGDDIPGLLAVTSRVPAADARPIVVILDSIKGQGVPYLEQLSNSHHLRLTAESKAALNETIRQLEASHD